MVLNGVFHRIQHWCRGVAHLDCGGVAFDIHHVQSHWLLHHKVWEVTRMISIARTDANHVKNLGQASQKPDPMG